MHASHRRRAPSKSNAVAFLSYSAICYVQSWFSVARCEARNDG